MKLCMAAVLAAIAAVQGVAAAPPAGGFKPIEDVVYWACQHSPTVVVAKVSRVATRRSSGGETRVASLEILRALKGSASSAPRQVSHFIPSPLMTDAFPTRLEAGANYVMFLDQHRRIRQILPGGFYSDVAVARVTELAEAACRSPLSPPDNSPKPTPLRGAT